jgi:hypothetical protein
VATTEPTVARLNGVGASLPPVLQAWVRQLLSPEIVQIVAEKGAGQIEVRLVANHGRVRRQPTVLLNAGNNELVPVDDVA